jgi:hypothetical protein
MAGKREMKNKVRAMTKKHKTMNLLKESSATPIVLSSDHRSKRTASSHLTMLHIWPTIDYWYHAIWHRGHTWRSLLSPPRPAESLEEKGEGKEQLS